MPETFSEQDFAAPQFSEADFLPAKPKRTREEIIASIPGGVQPEPTPFWARAGAALAEPVAAFTPHEMARTVGYAASKAGNVVMNPVWKALGYAPNEYEPGKPIVPIPAAHGTNLPPIATVPLRMLEGLTTPEGATMLAVSGGASAPAQLARTGFLTQIAEAAPESFGRLVNPEATSRERQESAIELALGALGFMGLGRSLGTKPTPSGLPPNAASYTLEGFEKRPAYETPIIGEQPVRPREVFFEEPRTITEAIAPTKPPITPSGGEISFRGEGVPSARQAREMLPTRASEQERLMQGAFVPSAEKGQTYASPVRGNQAVIQEEGLQRGPSAEPRSEDIQRVREEARQGEPGAVSQTRAQRLRETESLYHGTTQEFEGLPTSSRQLDPTLKNQAIFTSLSTSSDFAAGFTGEHPLTRRLGGRVFKVRLESTKTWDFRNPDDVKFLVDHAQEIIDRENRDIIHSKGGDILDKETFINDVKNGRYPSVEASAKFLQEHGYDAFTTKEEGVINYHVFNPSKIRSAIGSQEARGSIGAGIAQAIEKNKESGSVVNPVGALYTLGKGAANAAKEVVNLYSEPLQERIGRIGGAVAKRVSQEAGQIISQAKKYYGELTPEIDPAKVAAGKLARGGTTWIRGVDQITDKAAVSRAVGAIEGTKPVPPEATSMVTQLRKANLAIGQLAQKAAPGFTPSGKMQRMLTSYGVDIIRRGRGPAWDAWSEGIAKANDLPVQDVQVFLRRWKDNLDAPGVDVAALDKINQDFVRKFPNAVTHIKPGVAWHEVLVSDPFSYIEQAAQRTAHAAAFREVYKPQSGLLAATRKAVLKEIESGQYGGEFDKLMRALQGHPVDTFTSWWNAPDTPIGGAMRMAGQVVAAPMRSLVLTGNFLTNLGETVSGGPMIFLGPSNVLPAMKRMITDRTFYPQMEMAGAVNRAMQNYALDPTSPVRSTFRALSNTTRRVFAEQLMNELQEAQGAGSAKVLADRIRSQSLGPTEQQNAIAVFRAMGFTPQQAAEGVLRANADVLGQFERKASSFLTAGHQLMGERSTLGASRAFNELFWFHSYPQMALNQFRSVAGNLAEDIGTKNWSQARANAKLMGRLLGGRTFQGALTVGIMSLAYEGIHGAKERKQEAQDEFAKFLRDSFIAAMGGPLYLVKKGVEAGGDSRALQQTVGSVIAPVSIGGEIMDASLGNGRYEGQTATERAGAFLESKTPGFRAIRTGMALFGLSNEDKELETAKRAFYRWRREKMGWRQEIGTAGEDEDKRFRALMRKAVDALENGKDWRAVLTESGDIGRAGKSLGARALLKTPEGKDLSEEQLDALRKHIGTGLVDKLQLRDAMVRELGRVLREGQAPEKMAQPTGTRAIDFESATKRSNRVFAALPKGMQEFVKTNGIDSLSYTPEIAPGKKKALLSVEQARQQEAIFVEQLQKRLTPLMQSKPFLSANVSARKDILSRQVDAARRVATAIERGKVLRERGQGARPQ